MLFLFSHHFGLTLKNYLSVQDLNKCIQEKLDDQNNFEKTLKSKKLANMQKPKGNAEKTLAQGLPLSQAAPCDGMIYSVNYKGQNSVTQGYALPLFEN